MHSGEPEGRFEKCWVLGLRQHSLTNPITFQVNGIAPHLQMEKLRHRGVKTWKATHASNQHE